MQNEIKDNGYICFHKGKQYEVHAPTSYAAQKKCAEMHKIKKAHEITVVLAEKNSEQVVHVPTF